MKKEDSRQFIAIDLKSFYASVECRARNLDPLTTNLVVADASRTEKTICLAVSPSLKAYGIPGRARLFEVIGTVRRVNADRLLANGRRPFSGLSCDSRELAADSGLELGFITAGPRMKLYEDVSSKIYSIYLRYIAPEDIHVYSIDEVFIDATDYLKADKISSKDLAQKMILDILEETGITATCGIAPNMYLCKVAMDIVAKHIPADENGVRIAMLDEAAYRRILWNHRPLTDFWRVGPGIAKKLEAAGMYTMGDVAMCALRDEDLLYKLFGVNAEYLIDHAFGREPVTIEEVKAYKPASSSVGSGQVLKEAYSHDKASIIIREMAEQLSYDLLDKGLVTDQIQLMVGFDAANLQKKEAEGAYKGPVASDRYGRRVPKSANGSISLDGFSSSAMKITHAALKLYDEIADPLLTVRRLSVTANHTMTEDEAREKTYEQLNLFEDFGPGAEKKKKEELRLEREKKAQLAALELKKKFGKNAVLKGTDLQEGATTIERNQQIGGHKA